MQRKKLTNNINAIYQEALLYPRRDKHVVLSRASLHKTPRQVAELPGSYNQRTVRAVMIVAQLLRLYYLR